MRNFIAVLLNLKNFYNISRLFKTDTTSKNDLIDCFQTPENKIKVYRKKTG